MVRFSCFHAHIHSHKQKKTVQMSAEVIQKRLEGHSENHSLKDFSYCEATSPLHSKSVSNVLDIYSGHVIDSSSNGHGCKSEEIEDEYKSECNASGDHNKTADIKKCRSLGSGLGWEGRAYDDYDSEDCSHRRFSFDNFQEVLQPSSVQVSSGSANTESISLAGDQKQSEREEDDHMAHTPCTSLTVVKSTSLPNMHCTGQSFTPLVPSPRSAEDLIVLETRKEVMMDREIHVKDHEETEGYITNIMNITGEDRVGEVYDSYNYAGSAKDWILPASENINGKSLFCQLNKLPSKDFRLKRIEDWVTDLQKCGPPEEEMNEMSAHDNGDEKIHKEKVFNGSPSVKLDEKVNPGMEAVNKYISSLSASATSVQLVNHGLVAIPFLGTFLGLKALNLSGNAIVKVTPGTLPRGLHILNLSRNSISTVEGLRELTRLRVLDLSYNRIQRIGHGLAYCSSLRELYIVGNKISEIEGLHRLLKLNVLDLRYNKISTPKSLGQLAANYSSLQAISLEGNPAQKNVGHEQLKKHLQSLVPHLTYYNGQPIKIGASKDTSDRSCRLGIGSHQVDRGIKAELKVVRKGSTGVSSSYNKAPSSSIHGRKASKGRHGHLVGPSVARRSTHQPHTGDPKNRLIMSFGPDSSMRRSHSEGNLGPS
ncbi:unnamed protein product [Cuscuta epithymum]|uniref:Leucine-rich repeat family protein n=1 Tax=Cuscuta epithymum TaxID=186058 RepID=A0AAV0FJY1_9ASTE|nr:unnamed protein product [Cuscuta epithymum]